MPKSKRKSGQIIPPYVIGDQNHPWGGLNTATKDNRDMEVGESYDQMNWITGRDKDNIQLRRGQALLGTTRRNIANQHVSGLKVGTMIDGTQIPFYTFAQKIMYYNSEDDNTHEVDDPDILPATSNDEDVAIETYTNVAGAFIYLTSPNSGMYKIPVANPGSVVNQGSADFRFSFIKFDQSRMIACGRKGETANSMDSTGVYISAIDQNTPSSTYMSLPQAPTGVVVAGGGFINDGTYYYVITAIGPDGVETTKGLQSSAIVVSGGGGAARIHVSWTAIAGATAYKAYRTTMSGTYTTPALVTAPLGGITGTDFLDDLDTPLTGAPPVSTTQPLIAILGTGDGTTVTFSGILPSLALPATAYAVEITDGTETFIDNRNGVLIGSLGGTGTINYATQAYSVTFNTAPASGVPITGTFLQENATVDGVADFNIDGNDFTKAQVFRQDDGGGNAQSIFSYQGVNYCLHLLRSWQFQMFQNATSVATAFSNLPYYEQLGISYHRSAFQVSDGIIFVNNANPSQPTFVILQIPPGSTNLTVVPIRLSEKLDLSVYGFSRCVVRRWGDYDIIGLEVANQFSEYNDYNTICFIRNKWSGLWNKLDYAFSCLDQFYGMLLGGDSLSPNVFTLFSGFDDDGEIINNFYNHSYLDLEIDGLKTVGYLHVEGLIQRDQNIQVAISLDGGDYAVEYVILGNGPYVNQSSAVGIGTYTEGSTIIGGQGSVQQFAQKFELDIPIHTDRFEYISFQFKALQIGFAQVNKVSFKDIRFKRRRLLPYEDSEIDG